MKADSGLSHTPAGQQESWHATVPLGVGLAVLAAGWHAFLMTSATNDNFVHLTLAKQWLAGDWPVRDFFDHGWVLQYALSAAAQAIGGDRLMSEAIVVSVAWGVSTYLVFQVVRWLSGVPGAAALAALLPILAGARGYSYPKGIVYAVAAALWWRHVNRPTTAGIMWFGTWAAVAFYWRPDHGIYVAIALALAVVVAHGFRVVSVARCVVAGATMLVLLAPFFVYVQATVGLGPYAQTGLVGAEVEHTTQGPHEWPLLRFGRNPFSIEPAEHYAPTIGIRWSAESSPDDRREVLARHGLTPVESGDDSVERVRLSARALSTLCDVINEPIVEDTAGIDRSSASLTPSSWPTWQRWTFNHAWLRVQFLPWLDSHGRASEITVALFYALPILVMVVARWMAPHLGDAVTARRLVAFAAFALLVDAAMLRSPFPARAPDAVVLSAIVFGCCVAWLWRAAVGATLPVRAVFASIAVALTLTLMTNVALVGRFGERIDGLAGEWTSWPRARVAWGAAYAELAASPPLAYFIDDRARLSLRLAAYVRDCVPKSERLLVLWFEPEIYYYSDRLMAQRHLVFVPAWADLAHEQQMTLDRVVRFSPPIALARQSALDGYARASYPGVVDYVEREYRLAARVAEEGEEYVIFARRDRSPLRTFGPDAWPCFVREVSPWSRVGHPKD